MRITLAQLNPTIGDFQGNRQKILDALDHARLQSADMVVFPELITCGYPPEDLLLLPDFVEMATSIIDDVVTASKGLAIILGTPRKSSEERGLYNSAAIIDNGKLLGYHDKILLPTYDVFDEHRYFDSGDIITTWTLCGKQVAITVCEDLWAHAKPISAIPYERDPVTELLNTSVDLVVNLSASPYKLGKELERRQVVNAVHKTLSCPVVLCNQVGANDSLIFDGGSIAVNGEGKPLVEERMFVEELLTADLDQPVPPLPKTSSISHLYQALVLGIRDYFSKQGFQHACLGLSGGIDSAVVACLATEALGKDQVVAITMPSRYSSKGSVTDSQQLAYALGIELKEIAIEAPFSTFLDLLTPHFEGKPADVTEENLQARIRGLILMAMSNKHGHLVLSTGNKSELALGYSTLYGDMCGGLACISDVSKTMVYELANYINRDREVIPQNTIDKPPSAELRPDQKDSDTLPDYAIIDAVLEEYVEEHRSPEEIASRHHFDSQLVHDMVKKIHRNEYKRRQSPPGLRVTAKAFSVGRRFPIVQRWG